MEIYAYIRVAWSSKHSILFLFLIDTYWHECVTPVSASNIKKKNEQNQIKKRVYQERVKCHGVLTSLLQNLAAFHTFAGVVF